MKKKIVTLLVSLVCFGSAFSPVQAQAPAATFPSKPVRMFVGYPPGGEAGVPGFDVSSWYGVCTPGPLPKAVHEKFTADLLQLLQKPALRTKLEEQGIDITAGTPDQFVAHVRKETERWTKVVKAAGLGP